MSSKLSVVDKVLSEMKQSKSDGAPLRGLNVYFTSDNTYDISFFGDWSPYDLSTVRRLLSGAYRKHKLSLRRGGMQ